MFEDAMAGGGGGPIPEMAVGSGSPLSPTVRKYFPETWIWDCSNSGFVAHLIQFVLFSEIVIHAVKL